MIFFTIAYRNVRKNWRHSLSALLSISAAFVSLVLFDGYISDLKDMYVDSFRHRSMLGDLIIENPQIHSKEGLANPDKFRITVAQQKLIDDYLKQQAIEVKTRIRSVNFQGVVTNGLQSSIVVGRGYDLKEGEIMRGAGWSWNTTFGHPLHVKQTENAALMGQGLARRMACQWTKIKNFDTFSGGYEPVERPFDCPRYDMQVSVMTADGQLNAMDMQLVGLIDAGYKDIDDRYLIVPYETAKQLINSDSVDIMCVMLNNPNHQGQFINKMNDKLTELKLPLRAMSWVDHPVGETYVKTVGLMSIFRNFVVAIILVISVLSVINTLVKIIKERSREIGTLRSLGFHSRQVLQMFVYETLMLTCLGVLIGMVASGVITIILNTVHIRYKAGMLSEPVLFKIRFAVGDYLGAFSLLLLVSVLACLYATRNELRKKIVDNFMHA